jgi:protein SHQ1
LLSFVVKAFASLAREGMPLTPRFEIRQSSTHVTVTIHVPTIRVSNDTIEVLLLEDFSQLHFYAAPYLLKLDFAPRRFQDGTGGCGDGSVPSARYDPSEQTVTIPLLKADDGTGTDDAGGDGSNHWPNLDLTARLLQPREIPKRWLHSVVGNDSDGLDREDSDDGDLNGDGGDASDDLEEGVASVPLPPLASPVATSGATYGYGFANMFQGIFTDYCRSGLASEMLALQDDPGVTPPSERRTRRLAKEEEEFDVERYLQDLDLAENDDYMYPMVAGFVPWWRNPSRRSRHDSSKDETVDLASQLQSCLKLNGSSETTINGNEDLPAAMCSAQFEPPEGRPTPYPACSDAELFTPDERLLLSTVPYPLLPKSVLSSSIERGSFNSKALWCGLLDLLLAYTYDHLFTMGDATVESAWTIATLSPSLSWLDDPVHASVRETLVAFVRRCVIYPYWRSADFALTMVAPHTLALLKETSIPGITKALLQARQIFDSSEWYYVHNKIWVDPFLYWVQHQEEEDGAFVQVVAELEQLLHSDHRRTLVQSLGLDLERHDQLLKETMVDGESDECDEDESEDDSSCSESCSEDDAESDDGGAKVPAKTAGCSGGDAEDTPIETASANPSGLIDGEDAVETGPLQQTSRPFLDVEFDTRASPFLFAVESDGKTKDDTGISSNASDQESSPAQLQKLIVEVS